MIALLGCWYGRLGKRKVVTILFWAMAAALVAAAAVDRLGGDGPGGESAPSPLVSTQFIPAGTTGESILRQPWRYVAKPELERDVETGGPPPWPEDAILDPTYLSGRVVIVDIHPGTWLREEDIRLPVAAAPGWTLSEYSHALAFICGRVGVDHAASKFGVAPTAEDAAKAYVRLVPEGQWRDAAYSGCLRGFRAAR